MQIQQSSKSVLKNFAKFTGKHLCQSLCFNKVVFCFFLLKMRLWRRCFPVNFAKFLRSPFLQNTSGQLLLNKPIKWTFSRSMISRMLQKIYRENIALRLDWGIFVQTNPILIQRQYYDTKSCRSWFHWKKKRFSEQWDKWQTKKRRVSNSP